MKYLLIALVIAAAVGCGAKKAEVIVVNECQYVVFTDQLMGGLVHAGNCNNPIHVPPGGSLGTFKYDGIIRLDSLRNDTIAMVTGEGKNRYYH
jgi:hypothetical protein